MSTHSNTGESFAANLLMGAVIAASAFLLYASVALPQSKQTFQANATAKPAIEQVVVTRHNHVS